MKNKILLSTLSIASIASATVPMVALTSCSSDSNWNHPTAPGQTIDYDEALTWVKAYSQTVTPTSTRLRRENLAKSLKYYIESSNLAVNGTGLTTHYKRDTGKWIPVLETVDINYALKEKVEYSDEIENDNPSFSAVDVWKLRKRDVAYETPSLKQLMTMAFNPFLYSDTFAEIHKLSTLNSKAFSEKYSKTSDTLYVTYNLVDIKSLLETKEVKELMASNDLYFIPFRGEGRLSITFGFNKYGYLTNLNFTVDANNLQIYTGFTSAQYPLRPVFYGQVKGQASYQSTFKYFTIPSVKVTYKDTSLSPVVRHDLEPTKVCKWVYAKDEEFAEGDKYTDLLWMCEKMLPGYGSTIVVQGQDKDFAINLNTLEFQIGNTKYTYDEIGPRGLGAVTYGSYNEHTEVTGQKTYIFYFKPAMFDICNGVNLDIVIK